MLEYPKYTKLKMIEWQTKPTIEMSRPLRNDEGLKNDTLLRKNTLLVAENGVLPRFAVRGE